MGEGEGEEEEEEEGGAQEEARVQATVRVAVKWVYVGLPPQKPTKKNAIPEVRPGKRRGADCQRSRLLPFPLLHTLASQEDKVGVGEKARGQAQWQRSLDTCSAGMAVPGLYLES